MFLIKDNQKGWIFTDQAGADKFINAVYDRANAIELDTLNRLIESRLHEIQEGELIYIIKERDIKAFSQNGQLTCQEIVDLGFETFSGYELKRKDGVILLIRKDAVNV